MPGGEEVLLAGNWQGLDRATAPHLLDPSKSPDTTDAAYYGDKLGLLGPRGGRKLLLSEGYNLLGVIPYSFPWAEGRIIATAEGALRYSEDSFPSTTTAAQTGWDTIRIGENTPYIVSQSGIGTTDGADLTLATPLAMGDYGIISFAGPGSHYGTPCSVTCTTNGYGYVMFQGYIDGAWVDLLKISADFTSDAADVYQQLLAAGTGTMTKIRASVTVAGGGGLTVTLDDFHLKLIRGSEYQQVVAS